MIAMETSFQLDHIMIGGLECSVNNIMMWLTRGKLGSGGE
jgi:hypothetical protein